jgi:hypothetical protein
MSDTAGRRKEEQEELSKKGCRGCVGRTRKWLFKLRPGRAHLQLFAA